MISYGRADLFTKTFLLQHTSYDKVCTVPGKDGLPYYCREAEDSGSKSGKTHHIAVLLTDPLVCLICCKTRLKT